MKGSTDVWLRAGVSEWMADSAQPAGVAETETARDSDQPRDTYPFWANTRLPKRGLTRGKRDAWPLCRKVDLEWDSRRVEQVYKTSDRAGRPEAIGPTRSDLCQARLVPLTNRRDSFEYSDWCEG